MKIGLVGYPGSGKSTVFGALTGLAVDRVGADKARLGAVKVPDARVDKLSAMYKPKKTTHAAQATPWVHATITSGGIARARPLTTANCTAWVSAAPSDSANQVRLRPRRRPAERSSILCLRRRP